MISGRWALMVLVAFAFFLVERVAGKATACGETCARGACKFTDCKEPSFCPGGACTFKNCVSPTCEGGSCIFDSCSLATCEGGACTYKNHKETLLAGYCPGESCNLEGIPHPTMANLISV
jgi:hypothetical protein